MPPNDEYRQIPIEESKTLDLKELKTDSFIDKITKEIDIHKKSIEDFSNNLKRDFEEFKKDATHELKLISKDIVNQEKNFNEFKNDYKEDQKNKISKKVAIWGIIGAIVASFIAGGYLQYLFNFLKK